MSHVDDGTLHALLDGALRAEEPGRAATVEAHLERCPDCRARLESAAVLRGRAGQLLDLLDPDPRPDFQEVLARAGQDRRTVLARRARRIRSMAWAATIVLALGTGYLIRDRLVLDPPAEVVASVDAVDAARPEARRDAPPRVAALEPTAEPGPSAPAARAARTEPAAAAAERDPVAAPAAAPVVESARPPDAPRVDGTVIDLDRSVVATGAEPRRPPLAEQTRALRATDAGATEVSPGAPAGAPTAMALAGQVAGDHDAWRTVALEEALSLMDGSVYRLPDAQIAETLARGTGDDARILTRQRLPGGAEVLVTQSRADVGETDRVLGRMAADPTAPEAAADEPATPDVVRVLRSRYWLTLEGSLPAAALEALAAAAEAITER